MARLDKLFLLIYNKGMLSIDTIKTATEKVGKKYGIRKAYLFGSYAKGKATEDSDVDVVIEKGELRGLELSKFRLDLIDELNGTDVDVLTVNSLRPQFYSFIKNDMVPIYGA